jgi:hypothetical protein
MLIALGHRQEQLVSLGRADECERDTGVAAGRFDDHRVAVNLPRALGGLDHGDTDAVLYARERIEELALRKHDRLVLGDEPIDPHERRAADRLGDIVVDSAFWFSGHGFSRTQKNWNHEVTMTRSRFWLKLTLRAFVTSWLSVFC